tara:strand:+ start:6099 stop:6455 length:357 start_codon:yes stop_codon:yes gene_type:complete
VTSKLIPPRPVGVVSVEQEEYTLSIGSYLNGNLAIMMHTKQGEPYAVVSKNIPSIPVDGDQFFVNWYNLSPVILDSLSKCGFFEDTGSRIRPDGSHVELPLWQMSSQVKVLHMSSNEE